MSTGDGSIASRLRQNVSTDTKALFVRKIGFLRSDDHSRHMNSYLRPFHCEQEFTGRLIRGSTYTRVDLYAGRLIRGFNIRIIDQSGREVVHLFRPCRFGCCRLNELRVSAPVGKVIGYVYEKRTYCCPRASFTIANADRDTVFRIKGPSCCAGGCLGDWGEIDFKGLVYQIPWFGKYRYRYVKTRKVSTSNFCDHFIGVSSSGLINWASNERVDIPTASQLKGANN
uniref:Phospholipid scramblase n=1 Tax=Strigamia maritima TaxID=126957 RepID=T1JGA1_STRMM